MGGSLEYDLLESLGMLTNAIQMEKALLAIIWLQLIIPKMKTDNKHDIDVILSHNGEQKEMLR